MDILPWALALKALVDTNQEILKIDSIFYGDQDKLPDGVVVCVEPFVKRNSLYAATWKLEHTFQAYVYVYISRIQSPQQSRLECDALAEQLEALIHTSRTMGNTSIATWVENIEFGYSTKDTGIVRSAKLVVEARAVTQLA